MKLLGAEALASLFSALAKIPESPDLHKRTIEGARYAESKIRAELPRPVTGRLERSLESGGFKKRPGKPVAAFVRINRRIAPHAHLVAFGTVHSAPNDFFTRGWNKSKLKVEQILADGVGDVFDKALK